MKLFQSTATKTKCLYYDLLEAGFTQEELERYLKKRAYLYTSHNSDRLDFWTDDYLALKDLYTAAKSEVLDEESKKILLYARQEAD